MLKHAVAPVLWPKLESLKRLGSMTDRSFVIDPFFSFETAAWARDRKGTIEMIRQADLGPMLAIRSAAWQEDLVENEPPGLFLSVLGVRNSNPLEIETAVDKVIASYTRNQRAVAQGEIDRIIVQKCITNVTLSGIARLGNRDEPYIHVEYDDTSGRTDTVTSGLVAKRSALCVLGRPLPSPWHHIRRAMRQISRLYVPPFLIEFAIDANGEVHVFQVRPDRRQNFRVPSEMGRVTPTKLWSGKDWIRTLRERLRETGPLSNMADWNPAEMLGDRPRPLAVSLYKTLVTDKAWAIGRTNTGWRTPEDSELLVDFAGQPYIKLRSSFESLLPASLDQRLAARLVSDRLSFLEENQPLHDKVEFRVMWSGYDFGRSDRFDSLKTRGFREAEVTQLRDALKNVTREAIERFPQWHRQDQDDQERIGTARRALKKALAAADTPAEMRSALAAAVASCRQFGVIPFARQARLAFMFRDMLAMLANAGLLEEHWLGSWLGGIDTIALRVTDALYEVQTARMTRATFDAEFGHLRPHTYDILSTRYDELPQLPKVTQRTIMRRRETVDISEQQLQALDGLMSDLSRSCRFDDFLGVAKQAIQARESIKFSFSGLLSDVLQGLRELGRGQGLSDAKISFLTCADLIGSERAGDRELAHRSEEAQRQWARQEGLRFPEIAFNAEDFLVVRPITSLPTFIGFDRTEAAVILANGSTLNGENLEGKVALIQSPDPGFDWIFGCRIAGLITQYGGEFSHMAIRCAEFGLPAAIGCGEDIFRQVAEAATVVIDGSKRIIEADGLRLFGESAE